MAQKTKPNPKPDLKVKEKPEESAPTSPDGMSGIEAQAEKWLKAGQDNGTKEMEVQYKKYRTIICIIVGVITLIYATDLVYWLFTRP